MFEIFYWSGVVVTALGSFYFFEPEDYEKKNPIAFIFAIAVAIAWGLASSWVGILLMWSEHSAKKKGKKDD